VQKQKATILI